MAVSTCNYVMKQWKFLFHYANDSAKIIQYEKRLPPMFAFSLPCER